jgi:hypothetical protein
LRGDWMRWFLVLVLLATLVLVVDMAVVRI